LQDRNEELPKREHELAERRRFLPEPRSAQEGVPLVELQGIGGELGGDRNGLCMWNRCLASEDKQIKDTTSSGREGDRRLRIGSYAI
jgi:hypothetical protein